MNFTFNMLLGHIGSKAEVIAAHKAPNGQGFSKIRLFADDSDVSNSNDTLLICDAAQLDRTNLPSRNPPYLCLCTTSYDAVRDHVAELAESTSWIAVASSNTLQLMNWLLDWTEDIALWEQRASLTVAHNGSMQALLDSSAEAIGLPLAVCGPLYADYVSTKTLRADDPFF